MFEPNLTNNYDGTYTATATCVHASDCAVVTTANVRGVELFAWRQGATAQQAFPSLTAGEREALFITGMSEPCWDAMFAGDDDTYGDLVDDAIDSVFEDDTYTSGEQFYADYNNSDANIAYLNRGY